MKLSLVGAALATIASVVSAIAAPVPRSLENLFGRDVDGEFVDSLFTRTTLQNLADAHHHAMVEHYSASGYHTHVGETLLKNEETESRWYLGKAYQHSMEAIHHGAQSRAAQACTTNLTAKHCQDLLTRASDQIQKTELCKEDATRSRQYAINTAYYLGSLRVPHPGPFREPEPRH